MSFTILFLMVNSEDPDEMQYNSTFYQCLYCLLRLKQQTGTDTYQSLENATTDPRKVHNWQSYTYCINMYGKVNQNTKV